MPHDRSHRSRILRNLGHLLPISVVLALLGCQPGRSPVAAPPPIRVADLAGEIVRIDAEESARIASEVRDEVPFRLAADLELTLWAPEQLLEDPIALSVDGLGHVFVTGSERTMGLLDIRGHPTWMVPALAMRTVEEYRAFLRRELSPERSEVNARWLPDLNEDGSHDWRDLTVRKETVYRLVDSTGDGRADLSQVMFEGFDAEISDVAGGLLVHRGHVYVGIAPDLWLLRDTTGNGVLDTKESISHGYGVHPGFNGHGVSGVTVGPDGRIYWAVGDMGFNVVDREGRRWEYPAEGAILRAEPDGSGFEVFATGLRNTHEFVFDEYGNLISVDNDGDHSGEHERLVYLVDGSDSGWRVNWQFGKYTDPDNNRYNVWMDEGLYRPRFEGQAAYILPPVAAYHVGPAGMAYNPGTALGERWRNHFFVVAFHGSPANSRIEAFQLRESGAGFELARDTVVVDGILATGLDFGPDGALYVADWVEGWRTTGRGRVWRLDAPATAESPERVETRALLGAGFAHRSPRELASLLRHPDMRVRLNAQLELADRTERRVLIAAARQRDHQLARIHGVWGIGQLARRDHGVASVLVPLLRDGDDEVRAQAAKALGDVRYTAAADALVRLVNDPSPRVRFFAAEALGRIGHRAAIPSLVAMLEENDDADVYLRHAGALALARIGEVEPVAALADHSVRGVRIAAVVALRRMNNPAVARFLGDSDEYIVTEAARAINDDGGIEDALPDLARLLERSGVADAALLRRTINANLRVGTAEAAQRLAAFALRPDATESLRVEALDVLAVWPNPSLVDRVDGVYHGPLQRGPTRTAGTAPGPAAVPFPGGSEPYTVP
jgi:quinoprotein glucose dehydrogenase